MIDFCRRSTLSPSGLSNLAKADGFRAFGWSRRDALWQVEAFLRVGETPLVGSPRLKRGALPSMTVADEVFADYASAGLTTRHTPVDAFGERLDSIRYVRVSQLPTRSHGDRLAVFGLTISRHAPPTANGVIFLLLEDETGLVNVVVMPNLRPIYQKVLERATFIRATGRLETERGGINVVATHLEGLRP
jgi:error-prone DNA polymerase